MDFFRLCIWTHLLLSKIKNRMANSVDSDETAIPSTLFAKGSVLFYGVETAS